MCCDLCDVQATASTDEETELLQSEWYESILFDLCGKCRKTKKGIAMIRESQILYFAPKQKPSWVQRIAAKAKNFFAKIPAKIKKLIGF